MSWCTNCGRRARREAATACEACGWPMILQSGDATRPLRLRGSDGSHETIRVDLTAAPYVQVVRGPNAGSLWSIREGTTSVGRSSESDVFLDDVSVSRRHALLRRTEEGITVEDLGSLNGTYVNGSPLADARHLRTADLLTVGRYRLVFVG